MMNHPNEINTKLVSNEDAIPVIFGSIGTIIREAPPVITTKSNHSEISIREMRVFLKADIAFIL
jgi:hypothetical protein